MSRRFFEHPLQTFYDIPAADLTGGAGVYRRIQGPPGARGRIQHLQTEVTTGVTVAAAAVLIGVNGDTDKYASFTVPVSSADAVLVASKSQLEDFNWIEADTVVEIGTDGAATAGEASILIGVAWERK